MATETLGRTELQLSNVDLGILRTLKLKKTPIVRELASIQDISEEACREELVKMIRGGLVITYAKRYYAITAKGKAELLLRT